jgi:hypothetical protein
MRSALFAAVAAITLLTGSARAGYVGLVGNDTGGIIPWSPGIEPLMLAIASEHCARYAKTARITSVHRVYGDYIGFRCRHGPLLPEPVVVPPWVLWPWYKG